MTANPLVEIVTCKADGHWLSYIGKVVFETDYSYAEQMIKESGVEAIYNEHTGNKLMEFHLNDATDVDIAVMGEIISCKYTKIKYIKMKHQSTWHSQLVLFC